LKADPKAVAIRTVLAGFYLEQKKFDAAITEYGRLVTAGRPGRAQQSGLALSAGGRPDKSSRIAERTFAAAPATPQIDDTLG
jgi:hypothetical protein